MTERTAPDTASHVGVTGQHTTDGVPHGCTSLTPFLALRDAAGAVEFYRVVLGARVIDVTEMGGMVVHADLDLGDGHLQLGEATAGLNLVPPPDGDLACYSLGLYCRDVDAVVSRAERAGATIRDPFGVRWSIMSRVEDLSEAESARRVAEWAANQTAEL